MKVNNILTYVMFSAALLMNSCSDYVDTEIVSPEAPQDATGANFSEPESNVVTIPGEDKFTISLNRVNTTGTLDMPIEKLECSTIDEVEFCTVPASFSFADGKAVADASVPFLKDKCVFQNTYSLALSILKGEKDNPYASGNASTVINFSLDYKWEAISNVVVTGEGMVGQVPFEKAKNYDSKDKLLFRLNDVFSYISPDAESPERCHVQFLLNSSDLKDPKILSSEDIKNVKMDEWFNTGIPHPELNTDETKPEDKVMVFAKVTEIEQKNIKRSEEDGVETYTSDFTLTFDYTYSKVKDNGDIKVDGEPKLGKVLNFNAAYSRKKK